MIKKIRSRSWLWIAVSLVTLTLNAQSPDFLLGLPYNSPELTKLILQFEYKTPTESFLPFQQTYKQDYFKDGISMEYNSDISLFSVKLYYSGYSFQKYTLELPKGVTWGMNLDQVQKKTGLLEFDPTNDFI